MSHTASLHLDLINAKPIALSSSSVRPWQRLIARSLDMMFYQFIATQTASVYYLFFQPLLTDFSAHFFLWIDLLALKEPISLWLLNGFTSQTWIPPFELRDYTALEIPYIILIHLIYFVLVESVILWKYRTTLGKNLFNLTVKDANTPTLSFLQSIKRTLGIYTFGLGLNLSLWGTLACYAIQYGRLRTKGSTFWDVSSNTYVCYKDSNPKVSVFLIILFLTGTLIGALLFLLTQHIAI